VTSISSVIIFLLWASHVAECWSCFTLSVPNSVPTTRSGLTTASTPYSGAINIFLSSSQLHPVQPGGTDTSVAVIASNWRASSCIGLGCSTLIGWICFSSGIALKLTKLPNGPHLSFVRLVPVRVWCIEWDRFLWECGVLIQFTGFALCLKALQPFNLANNPPLWWLVG